MTPEQEVLSDLLAQIDASGRALAGAQEMLGSLPASVDRFETMSTLERVASTALLKGVEQLEDGLARTFRAVLKIMGVSLKGLYPLDIANHMVQLDVLEDGEAWLAVVKLRNELVHEYPLKAASRYERLSRAFAAIPLLQDAATRVNQLVSTRGLLP